MIKTIQGYFKSRGWKRTENMPSTETAQGKFCHEVWNNALSPKIPPSEAMQWLLKQKEEIN